MRDLQPYVGRTLEAKIIELDKNRNNVVLSRRAWLEETQKEQREDFLANLKPGEVRSGVVSSVVNFGAFVDLGGMDGLIHVSELSWKHVDHPGSVVAVGDEVTVQVLDVDLDRERISLSLKATQQDPWQEFATVAPRGRARLRPGHQARAVRRRSSRSATASRAWSTSRRCRRTTSTSPSRSSPPARSCGSRSSTSTSSAAGSACRSSRPPRAAWWPPSTRSTSASTRTTTEGNYIGPAIEHSAGGRGGLGGVLRGGRHAGGAAPPPRPRPPRPRRRCGRGPGRPRPRPLRPPTADAAAPEQEQ